MGKWSWWTVAFGPPGQADPDTPQTTVKWREPEFLYVSFAPPRLLRTGGASVLSQCLPAKATGVGSAGEGGPKTLSSFHPPARPAAACPQADEPVAALLLLLLLGAAAPLPLPPLP